MKTMQATELRKDLYSVLDELASSREPVQIVRFKQPIAAIVPSPDLPASRRKPYLDLNAISTFCKRHNVRSLALFGSILTDNFDERSDVDVLIDVRDRALGFHETCEMLDELESMFGRKVDLLTTSQLAPDRMSAGRRESISKTARILYETV